MMEWKLGQLTIDGKGSYGIGAPAVPRDSSKYTYLRITDINDDGTLNYFGRASVDDPNAKDYLLHENDIVFARTGNSTGRTYFYEPTEGELVYAGFLIKFSIDPIKVNPRILKYYTHSKPYYDWVHSFDTGATRGNINAKTLAEMPIDLPPRATQDKIVSILSSLDAQIENNNRINRNLEAQAQALFKSWFVDFEPWGGKMPEGWREGNINDLAEKLASGGTPKSMNSSYYEGDIRWYSTKELKDGFLIDSEKHISQEAYNNSATKMFPKETILMAIYAAPTVGRLGILTNDACFNQAAVGILPKKEIGYPFVYSLLLSERINLNNLACGAAQQNLNVGLVKNYTIIIPDFDIIKKYNTMAMPIFAQIRNNTESNLRLASLRDTLLPKLMKGEIEVCHH